MVSSILALTVGGCIEISGGGGGGSMPNIISAWRSEYNALRRPQATVHSVMNFYTEFSQAEDLRPRLARLDEPRAIQFLSVGIERLSRDLLLNPSQWGIEVDLPSKTIDGEALSNDPPLDISASARLYNFDESESLDWKNVSTTARALLEADSGFSKSRVYRVHVTAYVTTILRPERPNRLDYQVSVSTQLVSKSSSFADDDAFRPVYGFKATKVTAWQQALAKDMIETYLAYFRQQGLLVTVATSREDAQ